MTTPLSRTVLAILKLPEHAAAVEKVFTKPPMFLGNEHEEFERRRAAVNAALDGLQNSVQAAIQENRGIFRARFTILGALATAIVGVTIYAVVREAIVAGGVAGVGTLATAVWFLPQYRSLDRERTYLPTLVPAWRIKIEAATTEAELKAHADGLVAVLKQLDAGN